jgi:CheY-like chemotaxis protein
MSAETRQRAFEPFFTTKGPQSSGLGLAVSWGILTRHGGSITVEPTSETGTTICVRLPIGRDAPAPTESPRTPRSVTGARILVIEDEAPVREVLVDILREAGYRVVEAASGLEGLAHCETAAVDLVLSDVSMPGLSGWEVAEACRTRFPRVPVGLITGWGERLDVPDVERHGVRFIVAKPFQADDVLSRVAEVLS